MNDVLMTIALTLMFSLIFVLAGWGIVSHRFEEWQARRIAAHLAAKNPSHTARVAWGKQYVRMNMVAQRTVRRAIGISAPVNCVWAVVAFMDVAPLMLWSSMLLAFTGLVFVAWALLRWEMTNAHLLALLIVDLDAYHEAKQTAVVLP